MTIDKPPVSENKKPDLPNVRSSERCSVVGRVREAEPGDNPLPHRLTGGVVAVSGRVPASVRAGLGCGAAMRFASFLRFRATAAGWNVPFAPSGPRSRRRSTVPPRSGHPAPDRDRCFNMPEALTARQTPSDIFAYPHEPVEDWSSRNKAFGFPERGDEAALRLATRTIPRCASTASWAGHPGTRLHSGDRLREEASAGTERRFRYREA